VGHYPTTACSELCDFEWNAVQSTWWVAARRSIGPEHKRQHQSIGRIRPERNFDRLVRANRGRGLQRLRKLPRDVSNTEHWLSFNGYSRSTDRGHTFTDQGYLNPGPDPSNFLEGDPVVTCTDESTFYQSSIFETGTSTDASVSKSTDGGQTFGNPVAAVLKDGFFHFIDKPWMAVDPSNKNNLYVTYSDFDFSGTVCPFRVGIELARISHKEGMHRVTE
jgi:hypothetical protein